MWYPRRSTFCPGFHQEEETYRAGHLLRASSLTRNRFCSKMCPENKSGQHAASPGARGDTREQRETKHQTLSKRLCYIDTSSGSGAHPGSCVNTPGQHYSIPVTLKRGEKITICYCMQRPVPQVGKGRSLCASVLVLELF